ncbi:MAG: hypothetical protein ONB05_11685, partial [candidate division KSB1 bacterium]|nr:hypothetical protein [candidate division KSB1 bacterium]
PQGLKVISKKNLVILSWEPLASQDLVGINIYRKSQREVDFRKLFFAPPSATQYEDRAVVYDTTYYYQISGVSATFETPRSDPVSITPGPTYNWVADTDNGQIVKLTHDGLHEIFRVSIDGYPTALSVDVRTGTAWVIEGMMDRIYQLSQDGTFLRFLTGFKEPVDVAIDERTSSLWVADKSAQRVVKLDSSGSELFAIAGLKTPISLSLDKRTGDCWVADLSQKSLTKISSSGTFTMTVPYPLLSPQSLSVDSKDGSCWVADSSQVLKFTSGGQLLVGPILGFNFAYRIQANSATGECWVLDIGNWYNQSKVIRLSSQGQILLNKKGFSFPQALSVSLYDGSCLVADTYNDRVVKISLTGNVISELGGFSLPSDVAVEY